MCSLSVVVLPTSGLSPHAAPWLTHAGLVSGQIAGSATMGPLRVGPQAHPETYVGCMPRLQPALIGERFAGLEVWEHLVAAQLRWIDRHAASELVVLLPAADARAAAARLWQAGGASLHPEATRRLGLCEGWHAVRLNAARSLACLGAKAATAGLLERVGRASRGPGRVRTVTGDSTCSSRAPRLPP